MDPGHALASEGLPIAAACQCAQMRRLDFAEPQRASQRLERGIGLDHRAALLEPQIPVHADAREFRDFLATQTGRATPPPVIESHRFGLPGHPSAYHFGRRLHDGIDGDRDERHSP